MTVYISADAKNLREELASLRNQGGYQEQQFYFDGLVTNGTFDSDTAWTKGTGWTISGGVASSSDGSAASLTQTLSTTFGKLYEVTFTISNGSGSWFLGVRLGDAFNQHTFTTAGTKTVYLIDKGDHILRFADAASGSFDLDNVSVFEVDANNDVIHTMPKGWKPKDVFEDGLLQREGAANDYEVVYDGFDYFVKPTVAPSATTQTCVIGVKA